MNKNLPSNLMISIIWYLWFNNINNTDNSTWLKKYDYNTKISKTENKINDHVCTKYITIQELDKLTSDNFTARLKQPNLASKNDIVDIAKKQILMINWKTWIKKLLQIKQNIYLLKTN